MKRIPFVEGRRFGLNKASLPALDQQKTRGGQILQGARVKKKKIISNNNEVLSNMNTLRRMPKKRIYTKQ